MEGVAARASRLITGMIGPYAAAHPEDDQATLILESFTVRSSLLLIGRHHLARPRRPRKTRT